MPSRPGFGILEALIVLGIITFVTSIIVISISRDRTPEDLNAIDHAFSSMMTTARQETLLHHCALRLCIKAGKGAQSLLLEKEIPSQGSQKIKFAHNPVAGGTHMFTLPSTWKINAIYQGPEEQLQKNKGTVYCTIPPEGIIPNMLIHLEATQRKQVATLKSEPFQKTFVLHNLLIAPPKKTPVHK